jgi:hypothetical protein
MTMWQHKVMDDPAFASPIGHHRHDFLPGQPPAF